MSFIVEKMTCEDLLFVYSHEHGKLSKKLAIPFRENMNFALDNWIVDCQKNIRVVRLRSGEVTDQRIFIALFIENSIAIIEIQDEWCPAMNGRIEYISESLKSNILILENMFNEIFNINSEVFFPCIEPKQIITLKLMPIIGEM
jgi:hypothetical protein